MRICAHFVLLFVLSVLALVLATGAAHAGDYWVDAATGSDLNGTGSQSLPWSTITHALGKMPAVGSSGAHTLHVNPGVYDSLHGERFPITVPVGVRLVGISPSRSIIYGSGQNVVAALRFAAGTDARTEITRLGIHGGDPGILVDAAAGTGNGPIVRVCRLSNNLSGVRLDGPSSGTRAPIIEDCDVRANSGTGIQLVGAGTGCLGGRIQDCWIDGNSLGLDINGGKGDVCTAVLGCVVLGNTNDGVRFLGSTGSGVVISHVTARANGAAGLSFSIGSLAAALVVRNSIFHGNKTDLALVPAASVTDTCFGTATGSGAPKHLLRGCLQVDPKFLRAGDPTLSPFSPVIDTTTTLPALDPANDVFGQPRTADGDGNAVHAPDMGAAEYLPLQLSGVTPVPGGVSLIALDLPSHSSTPYQLGLAFSNAGIKLAGGRRLPLWPDALFGLVVTGKVTGLHAFGGTTNTVGFARARIHWPNDQRLRGFTFYCAGVTVQAGYPGGFRCVTNGLAITLK